LKRPTSDTFAPDASAKRSRCLQARPGASPQIRPAAVAWSLTELWASFGVVPAAVLGDSLGEYVAAAAAVLDLVNAHGDDGWLNPPSGQWRVEIKGGATVVLQPHERVRTLVAVTILGKDMT
jgi:hypothetical protein